MHLGLLGLKEQTLMLKVFSDFDDGVKADLEAQIFYQSPIENVQNN